MTSGGLIPFYYISGDPRHDLGIVSTTVQNLRPHVDEIVVVDDGTGIICLPDVRLISHEKNKGKAQSIRTGINILLERPDIENIVEIDADNEQDPNETPKLLEYLYGKVGPTLILGNRYTAPQMVDSGSYCDRIRRLQQYVWGEMEFQLSDGVTGFRAYNRAFALAIAEQSVSNGFGIATEQLAIAAIIGAQVYEVPLAYARRRKNFTPAVKLNEVLGGILCHKKRLLKGGFLSLIEVLELIEKQLTSRKEIISIGDLEFTKRGNNYTSR